MTAWRGHRSVTASFGLIWRNPLDSLSSPLLPFTCAPAFGTPPVPQVTTSLASPPDLGPVRPCRQSTRPRDRPRFGGERRDGRVARRRGQRLQLSLFGSWCRCNSRASVSRRCVCNPNSIVTSALPNQPTMSQMRLPRPLFGSACPSTSPSTTKKKTGLIRPTSASTTANSRRCVFGRRTPGAHSPPRSYIVYFRSRAIGQIEETGSKPP